MEFLRIVETRRISEAKLQSLFNQNLDYLEDGLQLVEPYVKIDIGQIDTLAIDDNNLPVIIEYKSAVGADKDALIQALSYYKWLKENVIWLEKFFNQKGFDIDFSEIRIFIVAPEFDIKTIKAVQAVEPHIILVKYLICEDGKGRERILPQAILDNITTDKIIESPKREEEHLRNREHLKPVYEKLKDGIKYVAPGCEIKSTKTRIAFMRQGRNICYAKIQSNAIRVALPLKGEIESERFGGWPSSEKWGYVKISTEEDVDNELMYFIELSYKKLQEN